MLIFFLFLQVVVARPAKKQKMTAGVITNYGGMLAEMQRLGQGLVAEIDVINFSDSLNA